MEDHDFQRCLVAAKRGDEGAFVVLFRSVQPLLLRYLRSVGGTLADDVAAETWLSIVRSLERFEGDETGWRAWVFTIARARLRDAQRRAARTPVPVDVASVYAGVPDLIDVPAAVEEIVSTEAALAVIAQLPPDQAEVVLLRHVAGLDVAHTAEVLGKRPGAVRVAAHRGLKRLAGLLTPAPATAAEEPCNAERHRVDY